MSRFDCSTCLVAAVHFVRVLGVAAVLHATLSFVGGTLIHRGGPAAAEVGFALQKITGINELIHWADDRGHDRTLAVLLALGDGLHPHG